jgi:hypothetical protein
MHAAAAQAIFGLALLGCTSAQRPDARRVELDRASAARSEAQKLLCSDIGDHSCRMACSSTLRPAEYGDCLLHYRFGSDQEALRLARTLHAHTLLGIDTRHSIDGLAGEEVELYPALPVGEHRHHLAWLHALLEGFASFVDGVKVHAPRPVTFEPRPRAFVFFRTSGSSYPSAYTWNGVIGYNLDGPLHTNLDDVRTTLFHELFHFNDARIGTWSNEVLGEIFASVIAKCGDAHDCLARYAPYDTLVPEGTYYGFDERIRDVREYAAELALRYYIEHEAILGGGHLDRTPFKCLSSENAAAWQLLVDTFFGGADLTPSCIKSQHPGSPVVTSNSSGRTRTH